MVTADIQASNGIIHVIDGVLKLPTIVDHIKANPSLSSLLGVVTSTSQAAVLTTLNNATGSAPLTVYAPDNGAFATATATGGFLVGLSDAQVSNTLRYHVESTNRVAGSTSFSTSADISVTTLYTPFRFTILRSTLKINDAFGSPSANVKTTNIQGTNGSVQIIDRVLRPM